MKKENFNYVSPSIQVYRIRLKAAIAASAGTEGIASGNSYDEDDFGNE